MIEWMEIILIFMALSFLFSSIKMHEDFFWGAILAFWSIILWFILATSILEMETPYQIYNATSGNIETGLQVYTFKTAPEMIYLFYLFAIVTTIYFTVYYIFIPVYNMFFKDETRGKSRE
jgi:hypothetical protein